VRPLQPRERRLVAVGVLVALLALVWFIILGPFIGGFFSRADERRQLADEYQRNQRVMAQARTWRIAAAAQRADAGRFSIQAPSEALAAEALKSRLARLAADEGFTVSAVSDLLADAPPGKVRMRADLQLTLTQLYESLRRLETEGTYVVVEYLAVSADRAVSTGRSAPLAVRLEITAAFGPARGRLQ
jgi:general secretion pathway protein M